MKKKAEILGIILIVIMFAIAGYAGVDIATKTGAKDLAKATQDNLEN